MLYKKSVVILKRVCEIVAEEVAVGWSRVVRRRKTCVEEEGPWFLIEGILGWWLRECEEIDERKHQNRE